MIRLGSIGSVPLTMHVAFPVMVGGAALLGQLEPLGIALVALTLHELGHTLAASLCGLTPDGFELMPFGGVLRMPKVGAHGPWQEACIAMGGPFVTLCCLLCTLPLRTDLAQTFARANAALLAFNLLPALPLDGGRALSALLAVKVGQARATRLLSWVGVLMGIAIAGLGVFAITRGVINPMLFLLGAYLAYAALKERQTLGNLCFQMLAERESRLQKRGLLPVSLLAVEKGTAPQRLVTRMRRGRYTLFVLLDSDQKRVSFLSEGEVLEQALYDSPRRQEKAVPL